MKINVVSRLDFGDSTRLLRLDAEFVDPDILGAEQRLVRRRGWRLRDLVEESGENFGGIGDAAETFRYVAIDDIDTADGLTYWTELLLEDLPTRAKHLVASGDLLVSNVRPDRGAITLIGERASGAVASSGFTRCRLKPNAPVSAEYLVAFLRTEHAGAQLNRRARNSMYPTVTPTDVLDVFIPAPTDLIASKCQTLVRNAMDAQNRFFMKYQDAEAKLARFLKDFLIPPSPVAASGRGVHWTEIRSTEALGRLSAHRVDAEFFRGEYQKADKDIASRGPSFLVGEYYDISTGSPLKPGSESAPYIKQAVLTNVGINWSAVSYEEGLPGPRTACVHSGDILLACTAHEVFYVGKKVDFVREVPSAIASTNTCVPDLMIIRPRAGKPSWLKETYVAAFLRHDCGRHQVQRCIRGLRSGHVYKDDVAKYVRVPLPPKEWLADFDKVSEMMEAERGKAKEEMTAAVRLVSESIRAGT